MADDEVDVFLAPLEHPLKADFERVRQNILGAGAEISEGIKWNAPSFRTATISLRFICGRRTWSN